MSAITGKPEDGVIWSEAKRFNNLNVEKVERALRGVYLIRHRHPGCRIPFGEVIYVGMSTSDIRERLRCHFRGAGNSLIPDFTQADPLGLWFQFTECEDPQNAEAWFLAQFEPICNKRDENPKDRILMPLRKPARG